MPNQALTREEMQEMLMIAALNFSSSRRTEFYNYLKQHHPFLYQAYCQIEGEG
jgi:hypothetical protein